MIRAHGDGFLLHQSPLSNLTFVYTPKNEANLDSKLLKI